MATESNIKEEQLKTFISNITNTQNEYIKNKFKNQETDPRLSSTDQSTNE
jgi:hypothetical protein